MVSERKCANEWTMHFCSWDWHHLYHRVWESFLTPIPTDLPTFASSPSACNHPQIHSKQTSCLHLDRKSALRCSIDSDSRGSAFLWVCVCLGVKEWAIFILCCLYACIDAHVHVFVTGLSSRESWSAPLPFKVIWNSSASLTLTAVCFSSLERGRGMDGWRGGCG